MKICIEKDGKLHKVQGYIGVKKRYLRSKIKEDWSYYIYYRIGGRDGKQVLKKVGTKSQGITARKASQIRQTLLVRTSTYQIIEKEQEKTIEDIWQIYSYNKARLRSYNSIKNFYTYLSSLIKKTPSELTTHDIDILQRDLETKISTRKKPLSPQTKVHIIKLLRTLINYGCKRGYCKKNPQLYFELPKIDNRVTEFLSKKQLKAYVQELEKISNPYAKAFIKIALYTGMRKRAILELEWKNINFEKNHIYLEKQKSKKRQADFIPLPKEIKKILQNLPRASSHIFKDINQKPYTNYYTHAKKLKEKIGLPREFKPFYMLRHNFASMLGAVSK